MKKKIFIIGATSEIAKSCADIWLSRGDEVFLAGRDQNKLNLLNQKLSKHTSAKVFTYTVDLNFFEKHSEMIALAYRQINGFDVAFIAHGMLPNQKDCENDVTKTMLAIKTNALSTISILTLLANYFEHKKKGNIVFLSSVAADRGRASNYVYGSSKALVNEFISGLRQRLHKYDVTVTNIKLGFVDTPMTVLFKKGILWAKPKKIAIGIVKAIDQNKNELYLPMFWAIVMGIIKKIPTSIFKKLNF